MGEISEALERARQEEARQREERRKRRTSEVAESLRQAAVESALREDDDGSASAVPLASAEALVDPGSSMIDAALDTADDAAGRHVSELHPVVPTLVNSSGDRIEQCRHLANRVAGELERRSCRTLAVVSSLRMEGKSTVSSSLALAAASLSQGRSVALVDLDLRRPTVGSKLGLEFEFGVESVLEGKAKLDDVRISVEQPVVDIYPAHPASVPAHELLVLPEFARMISDLSDRYRLVFIDTPPTLLVPDANLILKHVGACVAVARTGFSRARMLRRMFDLLPQDRVIGTILNATSMMKLNSENYTYYGSDAEAEVAP